MVSCKENLVGVRDLNTLLKFPASINPADIQNQKRIERCRREDEKKLKLGKLRTVMRKKKRNVTNIIAANARRHLSSLSLNIEDGDFSIPDKL